ncbi:hypothetical protein JZ751_017604 [Albula glossodonta]|uniref:tRNA-intron lyase n=1 Tax=Albula glossodonta TaxID=121402 RepID=A0A8T2PNX8_9TELE|nr:hypothetical protein JZ751_017604 [Albula glossodonta]
MSLFAIPTTYKPYTGRYQQRLNFARDVLLAQELDEEDVNQMLEKYTQPIALDLTEGTTDTDTHGDAICSLKMGDETGRPANSEGPEPSRCDLCEDQIHPAEGAESDCPGGKRQRRQGDPRHDPLAHLYPQEPEPVDLKALASRKCSRHDDWLIHCGCRLSDGTLETGVPQNEDKRGPSLSSEYEYVLVQEPEGADSVENGSFSTNRGDQLVCRINPFRIVEYLQLSLEEEPLTIAHLWEVFRSVQPNFETTYMAYHYLRCKGWVPKAGMKYGSDFSEYQQ